MKTIKNPQALDTEVSIVETEAHKFVRTFRCNQAISKRIDEVFFYINQLPTLISDVVSLGKIFNGYLVSLASKDENLISNYA